MLDIAQTITDKIISELEKGSTPWVKPWKSA
jgi:antirestriction protein ArdC